MFCSFHAISSAQTQRAKDSLMKVMVAEACNEIKKKDFSSVKKEDMEMELGMAVIPVFSQHSGDIKDILNVDITDAENMKDFGQTLGMRLAVECPDFMRVVAGSSSFSAEVKKASPSGPSYTLSGTLVKVVPGEISHFLVKDNQGKTQKIWWMEYVDGDEKLKDVKFLSKPILVKYKETEVYSAAVKDYIKIKIATGIDK